MIWNLDMSWLSSLPMRARLDNCLGYSLHLRGISYPPVQTHTHLPIHAFIDGVSPGVFLQGSFYWGHACTVLSVQLRVRACVRACVQAQH